MEDLAAPLIAATREFLEARAGAGETLVVAVSGGSDSVALLDIVAGLSWPGETLAASYDHGGRAGCADDVRFVQARAEELGVPLQIGRSATADRAGRAEQQLRSERYDFLADVAARCGGVVLTGHTADDQAESVLAQLLRGAGPAGLRGVALETTWRAGAGAGRPGRAPVRILRPFLHLRRAELRQMLEARGLGWREDPTNRDGSNLRGRLREEVMPLLAEIGGRDPVIPLARLAGLAAVWLEDLDSRLPLEPSTAELRTLPDALLTRWLHRLGCPSQDHVEWAVAAIRDGRAGSRSLPGARTLVVRDDHVLVTAAPPPRPPAALPPHALTVTARTGGLPEHAPPGTCYLDAALTPVPLSVRSRRAGDRFHPLGLAGTKLVSDLLTDLKIPARERDAVPIVVTAEDEIAWVVPYRLDGRFAATKGSRRVLEVRLGAAPGATSS